MSPTPTVLFELNKDGDLRIKGGLYIGGDVVTEVEELIAGVVTANEYKFTGSTSSIHTDPETATKLCIDCDGGLDINGGDVNIEGYEYVESEETKFAGGRILFYGKPEDGFLGGSTKPELGSIGKVNSENNVFHIVSGSGIVDTSSHYPNNMYLSSGTAGITLNGDAGIHLESKGDVNILNSRLTFGSTPKESDSSIVGEIGDVGTSGNDAFVIASGIITTDISSGVESDNASNMYISSFSKPMELFTESTLTFVSEGETITLKQIIDNTTQIAALDAQIGILTFSSDGIDIPSTQITQIIDNTAQIAALDAKTADLDAKTAALDAKTAALDARIAQVEADFNYYLF
jgi:hypothetical protein